MRNYLIFLGIAGFLFAMFLSAMNQTGFSSEQNKNKELAEASIEKGVEFLRSKIQEDTYWGMKGMSAPGLTALATSALLRAGHAYGDDKQVSNAVDYLAALQKEDGGFYETDYPNYHTAVIIMALALADKEKFDESIQRGVAFLKGLQFTKNSPQPVDAGGIGYGSDKTRSDLSNTQYALDALKAAGVEEDDPVYQEALKFISRCQNNSETNDQEFAGDDGGFVYRPGNTKVTDGEWVDANGIKRYKSYGSMTYAGVKSLIHCGAKKDDPRIQQAMKWIAANYTLDENPMVGQQGLYYYYHTFAKALYVLGEDTIKDEDGVQHNWRDDLTKVLGSLQAKDGSWVNTEEKRWFEGDPILATSYALLALEWSIKK